MEICPTMLPWWGGWWERLVRSVKSCLKKTLHFTQASRTELETILIEIEFIINSRPLTYISEDHKDPSPLTPNHFLLGRPVGSLGKVGDKFESSPTDLLFCYTTKQQSIAKFWDMWSKDYLRNLPPSISKPFHVKNLKIGDLVMIEGDNKFSRLTWPLGVVKRVFSGPDNVARSFELKTAKGTLRRSIQCLHSMESDHNNHTREKLVNANNTREIHNNVTYERERSLNADNTGDFHINAEPHTGENSYNNLNESNFDTSILGDLFLGENEPSIESPVPEVPEGLVSEPPIVEEPEMPAIESPIPEVPEVLQSEPPRSESAPTYVTRSGRTIKPRNILDL